MNPSSEAADEPRERRLFMDALAIADDGEQRAFLQEACGDDAALRERIERLLKFEGSAPEGFLTPASGDRPALEHEVRGLHVGASIAGRYELVEQIGEGAFGLVYRAQQLEPVRRDVAIKLIKPGMGSSEVAQRFSAERQALALMDHPGIARVFDGGTTDDGFPYFVMELVRGVPITEYCDGQRLTVGERLELFQRVCAAVEHAHQKGVIHRDLKPANILVVEHEGVVLPKVIDFGIAKAIAADLAGGALLTGDGRFVGTPQYMSPEQMRGVGDIDTRADIYALGALLYELLAGAPPLGREQLEGAGWGDLERLAQEIAAWTPSRRLAARGDGAPAIADARSTDRARLCAGLRGDLDWITMKALEFERERRYGTASDLGRDVESHLRCEPVEAGPPSTLYRWGKWLRRNRVAATGAAGVVLVLIAGAVTSSILAARALRAEGEAAGERSRMAAQLSRQLVERGEQTMSEGDAGGALLWYVAALEAVREGGGASRAEEHRMRIANAFRAVPPTEWVANLDGAIVAISGGGDGRWLAASTGSRVHVFDGGTGAALGQIEPEIGRADVLFADPAGKFLVFHNERGRYLHFWDAGVHGGAPVAFKTPGNIHSVSLNDDGSLLAVGTMGGGLAVYDTASREVVSELESAVPATTGPAGCRFLPGGDAVVVVAKSSAGDGWVLTVVDAVTRDYAFDPVRQPLASGLFPAIETSGDGKLMALSGHGSEFRVLNTHDGSETGVVVRTDGRILDAEMAGDRIVTITPSAVELWKADAPATRVRRWRVGSGRSQEKALHPAAGGGELLVRAQNVIMAGELGDQGSFRFLRHHEGMIGAVHRWDSGSMVASGDESGVLRVGPQRPRSDVTALNVGGEAPGFLGKLSCATYFGEGRWIAGSLTSSVAAIWDASTSEIVHRFDYGDGTEVEQIRVSPDGRRLFTGDSRGVVRCYEGGPPWSFSWAAEAGVPVDMMHVDSRGETVVTHGSGDARALWRSADGTPAGTMALPGWRAWGGVLYDPTGRWALSKWFRDQPGHERRYVLHRLADGVQFPLLDLYSGQMGQSIVFAEDGSHLVGGQQYYRLAGAPERSDSAVFRGRDWHSTASAVPGGGGVALADVRGGVTFWEPAVDEPRGTRIQQDGEVFAMAFDAAGGKLATGAADGTVRIWSRATGQLLAGPMQCSPLGVVSLEFNPTANQLLIVEAAGRLLLWDLAEERPGEPLEFADVKAAAEVLANRRVDESGGLVLLPAGELSRRWQAMNPVVERLVGGRPGR